MLMFRGISGRRRVQALALAGMLTVMSWGAIWLWHSLDDGIPDEVQVPARHVGDTATYTFSYEGAGEEAPSVPDWVAYRWGPVEQMPGPWGDPIAVQRLEAWTEKSSTMYYVSPDGRVMARLVFNMDTGDEMSGSTWVSHKFPRDQWLCALVQPFQGEEVASDEDIPLHGQCVWPLVSRTSDDAAPLDHGRGQYSMALAGLDESSGRQQVRYEGTDGSAYWYDAAIPAATGSREPVGEGAYLRATLVGFAPGEGGGLASRAPLDQVQAPPLQPVHRWGPDDAVVDWWWSPSEAFQMAVDRPDAGELRSFLEEHPDSHAYYVKGSNTSNVAQGILQHQMWMFGLRSAEESFGFKIRKTIPQAEHAEPIVQFDRASPHVSPGDDPGTMPTSLSWGQALWRAEQFGDLQPLGQDEVEWYARTRCSDTCSSSSVWQIEASRAEPLLDTVHGNVEPQSGSSSTSVRMDVDDSGRTVRVSDYAATSPARIYPQPEIALGRALGDSAPESFSPPGSAPTALPEAVPWAAAGLLAVLVGAWYWAWPLLRNMPGLALFSRIQDDAVLDHPTRRRITEILAKDPGLHFAELAKRTELSHGVLTHHLKKLVFAQKVAEATGKGYTCYFIQGTLDRRVMMAIPVLKSEGARRLLELIASDPGLSVSELSERVEVSLAATHHHVKRLEKCGLVRKQRDGRRVCHFPEHLARDTLQHLG